jgi:prepilin-type N-terminal cleavage/methylation domain-containing protein
MGERRCEVMKMFRRDEGFTLVELMVVVLIIGILVAIAIPIFNAAKGNAQLKSCYANQRTIEGAIQTYSASNDGTYPFASASVVSSSSALVTGGFIKATPECPAAKAVSAAACNYHVAVGDVGTNVDTVDGDTSAAAWTSGHGHF